MPKLIVLFLSKIISARNPATNVLGTAIHESLNQLVALVFFFDAVSVLFHGLDRDSSAVFNNRPRALGRVRVCLSSIGGSGKGSIGVPHRVASRHLDPKSVQQPSAPSLALFGGSCCLSGVVLLVLKRLAEQIIHVFHGFRKKWII